jgi:hypothetical protein
MEGVGSQKGRTCTRIGVCVCVQAGLPAHNKSGEWVGIQLASVRQINGLSRPCGCAVCVNTDRDAYT